MESEFTCCNGPLFTGNALRYRAVESLSLKEMYLPLFHMVFWRMCVCMRERAVLIVLFLITILHQFNSANTSIQITCSGCKLISAGRDCKYVKHNMWNTPLCSSAIPVGLDL